MDMATEYDVIVIGGGITGAGTARDCALRGLRTLLVERGDIADGASGRNHGLLHSGARYAMTDRESAEECIRENRILRRIASNCVEETDGLFITLPEDDLAYQKRFVESCRKAGIPAKELDPADARRLEPSVNPALIGAVRVPDASVDPFRLTSANILDACMHGADVLTYTEVLSLIVEGGGVQGVNLCDKRTGEKRTFRGRLVVNAAGIWSQRIASMAGASITMFPAKGALLIYGHRVNHMVINRCRKPSNADILVPGDVVTVIGTTSDRVPFEECDHMKVTPEEVRILQDEGNKLAPALSSTRILRAYAGVRPLVASDDDPTGRSISRGIVLLDHAGRDGIDNFLTITGGKLTSYRLMAQKATDLVCRKLGVKAVCTTDKRPLPGSEPNFRLPKGAPTALKTAVGRHGSMVSRMDFEKGADVVCECEQVSRAEIEYAVKYLGVKNLQDLRRRTRMGMGTCQGSFCIAGAATALSEALGTPERRDDLLREYLQERWKGMIPVCWGDTLREAEFMRKRYGYEI